MTDDESTDELEMPQEVDYESLSDLDLLKYTVDGDAKERQFAHAEFNRRVEAQETSKVSKSVYTIWGAVGCYAPDSPAEELRIVVAWANKIHCKDDPIELWWEE